MAPSSLVPMFFGDELRRLKSLGSLGWLTVFINVSAIMFAGRAGRILASTVQAARYM